MKIIASALISLTLLLNGCGDPSILEENPNWVYETVSKFKAEPVGNPPQSIWRYEYKGQAVYYIPAQCCDQFSALFDKNGKAICAPDGGFSGRGDGRCPDFFAERKNEKLVWKDTRTR